MRVAQISFDIVLADNDDTDYEIIVSEMLDKLNLHLIGSNQTDITDAYEFCKKELIEF